VSYAAAGDEPAAMAMLQRFVPNQGNAWDVTVEELGRYFERVTSVAARTNPQEVAEAVGAYLRTAEILGRRTGELHMALASAPEDPAFRVEPFSAPDLMAPAAAMRKHAAAQLALLEAALPGLDERRRQLAAQVLAERDDLLHQFDTLRKLRGGGGQMRCHGDYHLGQVLVTEGDVVILDFEGEPARPLADRRQKCSPLRDVAGMVRSFSYAAFTGLGAATHTRPENVERLAPWADVWEAQVSATFLRAYRGATPDADFLPSDADDFDVLLHAFVLDKAMYELGYELNNRPDWVHIPLSGLLRLQQTLHA